MLGDGSHRLNFHQRCDTHLSLTIGDVPKMSITLSIALRKGFLTRLDKSLKSSCHPRRVIHVKLDSLKGMNEF